jgi:NAD(P)-dependent dehydrogenase (short-subunit alcohol dehydrogenase family)
MECAAKADGIRVNTVHPGVIDTPIWTKLTGIRREQCADRSERSGQNRGTVRLGRAGAGYRERRSLLCLLMHQAT